MFLAVVVSRVAEDVVAAANVGDGMSPFMQLILALAILIAGAKLAGLASMKLGQPAVLGELLVGLLLGPSLLDMFALPFFTDEHLFDGVLHIAELGVLLLMFVAGLEVKLEDLISTGKVATLAGVLGVLVPLGGGFLLAWTWFSGEYSLTQDLFVGVLLTATSVSISAQTLLELGRLRSRVGLTLLGAAVIDDILVIVILSTFVALVAAQGGATDAAAASSSSTGMTIVLIIGAMIAFFVVASVFGMKVLPWLTRKVVKLPISQGLLSFAIVLMLVLSWSAEVLGGVAGITGAFMIGIFFGRTPFHNRIEQEVQTITYSFFVPVFFASIGLQANLRELSGDYVIFALALCAVAIATKVIGCGVGALMGGMSRKESLQIGVGMISRGEVGLIVAAVGIREGIIGQNIFGVTVLMVLVTTLVTPLLLRMVFSKDDPPAPLPKAEQA